MSLIINLFFAVWMLMVVLIPGLIGLYAWCEQNYPRRVLDWIQAQRRRLPLQA